MRSDFAAFIIGGFFLGIVYDASRFFRLLLKSRVVSFLLDFLFCIISALVFFVLLLSFNYGSVRMLYLILFFLGMLIYVLTIFKWDSRLQASVVTFFHKILKQVLKVFKKVLQFFHKLYYNKLVLSLKPLQKKRGIDKENEEDYSKAQGK